MSLCIPVYRQEWLHCDKGLQEQVANKPVQETKRFTHVVSSKEGPIHRRAMLHAMLELAQDVVMDLSMDSQQSDPNQTKMER